MQGTTYRVGNDTQLLNTPVHTLAYKTAAFTVEIGILPFVGTTAEGKRPLNQVGDCPTTNSVPCLDGIFSLVQQWVLGMEHKLPSSRYHPTSKVTRQEDVANSTEEGTTTRECAFFRTLRRRKLHFFHAASYDQKNRSNVIMSQTGVQGHAPTHTAETPEDLTLFLLHLFINFEPTRKFQYTSTRAAGPSAIYDPSYCFIGTSHETLVLAARD